MSALLPLVEGDDLAAVIADVKANGLGGMVAELSESQRALIAARIATRTPHDTLIPGVRYGHAARERPPSLSNTEAGALFGISRDLVVSAKKVLTCGTAEEIESVALGRISATTMGDRLRAKTKSQSPVDDVPPKPAKKATLSSVGRNPERIQKQQMNAEIWGRVKEALVHLTSLPAAADVVAIVRSQDRTGLIDQRVESATLWLMEFCDACKVSKCA